MRVLGDKIGSNLVAQKAGVSTMPWNGDGMTADLDENGNIPFEQFDAACIHTEQEAIDAANRIGYPVMLKASEGGGGKGIRMAKDEAALRTAYPQVLGEVPGSPVFLVQLCVGARHLEVQVVGDAHGNAIALGGRDCSTQRRFQKIFEEVRHKPPPPAKPARTASRRRLPLSTLASSRAAAGPAHHCQGGHLHRHAACRGQPVPQPRLPCRLLVEKRGAAALGALAAAGVAA